MNSSRVDGCKDRAHECPDSVKTLSVDYAQNIASLFRNTQSNPASFGHGRRAPWYHHRRLTPVCPETSPPTTRNGGLLRPAPGAPLAYRRLASRAVKEIGGISIDDGQGKQ